MSADESGDAAISWNYQKIPTRIAAAHPELVDTLPSPELQAGDGGRTEIVAKGGGGDEAPRRGGHVAESQSHVSLHQDVVQKVGDHGVGQAPRHPEVLVQAPPTFYCTGTP